MDEMTGSNCATPYLRNAMLGGVHALITLPRKDIISKR